MIGDITLSIDMKKKVKVSDSSMFSFSTDTSRQLDHSLSFELSACSPTTFYESPEGQHPLASPCTPVLHDGLCSGGSIIVSKSGIQHSKGDFNFELSPQFEQRNDLSCFPLEMETVGQIPSDQLDLTWGMEKDGQQTSLPELLAAVNKAKCVVDENVVADDEDEAHRGGKEPTLAELNFDSTVSLFDDIESIIDSEATTNSSATTTVTVKEIKQEPETSPKQLWIPQKLVLAHIPTSTVQTTQEQPLASPIIQSSPILAQQLSNGGNQLPTTTTTTTGPENLSSPQATSTLLTPVQILASSTTMVGSPLQVLAPLTPLVTTTPQVDAAKPLFIAKRETNPQPKVATKRNVSPEVGIRGNIERKWEEIMEFINSDEDAVILSVSPEKKIKIEMQDTESDVAFNPSDQMESPKDDEFESDVGSDCENDDNYSDAESITSHSSFVDDFIAAGRKEKRYFWQYNMQSKGPKGKRLCKVVEPDDPHILNYFEDPVFDPELNKMRYKHNGKARRGDGNDITPNPYKLCQIGNELNQLTKKINCMMPVSEMPVPVRNNSRKEKNKFASRACRLKKKAQHEANKLKLHGLEQEHHQLMFVLGSIKHAILMYLEQPEVKQEVPFSEKLEQLVKTNLRSMIGGHTTEYVNAIIEKVTAGDRSGGIHDDDIEVCSTKSPHRRRSHKSESWD